MYVITVEVLERGLFIAIKEASSFYGKDVQITIKGEIVLLFTTFAYISILK